LAGAIAAVFGSLHALQNAEGGCGDVGRRRGKVGVIEQVGEGSIEAQAEAFGEMEILGEAGSDGGCAGAKENADAAIPDRAGWNGIESVDVEHAAVSGEVGVSSAIGTLKRTAMPSIVHKSQHALSSRLWCLEAKCPARRLKSSQEPQGICAES
jgi:hypothetical protein